MRKRWLAGVLAVLLLAGCTPAVPEPSPIPTPAPVQTPAPTPTPARSLELDGFLQEINARRRAVIEDGEPLDITPWTPDFSEQNDTFTQAELEVLTTPRELEQEPVLAQLQEDAETVFTLLRTTYGAYEYFGGDEVFLPLRDQVLEELALEGRVLYRHTLQDLLYNVLSPIIRDGHFKIGDRSLIHEKGLYMYYVPGLYFTDTAGLDPAYVKPTVGPDGAIVYWFAALSHDGSDLPSTLGGYDLHWEQAGYGGIEDRKNGVVFSEREQDGIPVLVSRGMYSETPEGQAQLDRFAACGEEYADVSPLVFDLRFNPGGMSNYFMYWAWGWTGQQVRPRNAGGHRFSQLGCFQVQSYPKEQMGTWGTWSADGQWIEREGLTLVLMDKGIASAGEEAVERLHSVENVVFLGGPTSGCSLVSNNIHIYLPRTGLELYFGTGLSFHDTIDNIDGTGNLPDLWVEPADALDAAVRLCRYYGVAGKTAP